MSEEVLECGWTVNTDLRIEDGEAVGFPLKAWKSVCGQCEDILESWAKD